SITNENNDSWLYEYNPVTGVLTNVIHPDTTHTVSTDNPMRTYHYEDTAYPTHLTGITDERNNRTHTWGYDAQGRVILVTHGDANSLVYRHTVAYNTNGTTTVTDPAGQSRTYTVVVQE